MRAPKPASRSGRVSLWRYTRLFRRDILSAQPARLYRAWMAEFRTPFFRSFLLNQPDLINLVLRERPQDFPKSRRVTDGLKPLLGNSVFVSNGEDWAHQRRIIDPAFAGGRVKEAFPAMLSAGTAAARRIMTGPSDIEPWASYATADVIMQTLFSRSIDDDLARETYDAFRTFQRVQPVVTAAAAVPGLPVRHPRRARDAARRLRELIQELVAARRTEIKNGSAPDDLATRLMTATDHENGRTFSEEEMVDQVAIFFLAGHETSASLLGWALWLVAASDLQDEVAKECASFVSAPSFSALAQLKLTRNCLRETLRLYPPVPMMVREAVQDEEFRDRHVPKGSQIVVSPWHLQRHERLWNAPDDFNPRRWEVAQDAARNAYLPFSSGERVCPGAGFAMAEATVLVASTLAKWRVEPTGEPPVPVAHLTVRAREGIHLAFTPR